MYSYQQDYSASSITYNTHIYTTDRPTGAARRRPAEGRGPGRLRHRAVALRPPLLGHGQRAALTAQHGACGVRGCDCVPLCTYVLISPHNTMRLQNKALTLPHHEPITHTFPPSLAHLPHHTIRITHKPGLILSTSSSLPTHKSGPDRHLPLRVRGLLHRELRALRQGHGPA